MSEAGFGKQMTRDIIKSRFLEMYKTKPLYRIKVNDLAAVCNISRNTFYFYFEDMQVLYYECERDLIARVEEGLSDVILTTVVLDFENYVKCFSYLLKNHENNKELFRCFINGSEESCFRKAWFESIHSNYSKTLNFSRAAPPVQRDYLARFFAGGMLSILSHWLLTDCMYPVEDVAYISAQTMFQGIFLAKQI